MKLKDDLLCALFILLLLPMSCKTQKDTSSKTDLKIENKTNADVELQSSEVKTENSSKDVEEKANHLKSSEFDGIRTIEENEIEYDTSKPIDPVTGKPPVKKERNKKTTEEGKKKDLKKDESSLYASQNNLSIDSTGVSLKDNSDYNIKESNKTEERESLKVDKVKILDFTTITVIVIVIVILILILKHRKIKK
jgi:hypothetical protein